MAASATVFSRQANPVTVTLHLGAPGNMSSTALSCLVASNTSCTVAGSVAVLAGSFLDLSITGADGNSSGLWTALTCN
ncbi:MAG TPA: hypothetical protein VNW54_02505 [Granulicella sp.]|nr:hypothetical protein [Granulicella sp.]